MFARVLTISPLESSIDNSNFDIRSICCNNDLKICVRCILRDDSSVKLDPLKVVHCPQVLSPLVPEVHGHEVVPGRGFVDNSSHVNLETSCHRTELAKRIPK